MKHVLIVRRFTIVIAAAISMAAGAVQATETAGIAAGVVGTVLVSGGARTAPEPLKSGMAIMVGERVQSQAGARLQIMLMDETVFTLGPDSELVIDAFVFEPAGGKGRMSATSGKGLMHYVSGQIAKDNPGAVTIKTPSVILGVRGTALFIMDDPEANDGTQFIGLLGPGDRNNGNLTAGGITVSGSEGEGGTDVNRAGFGVFASPQQGVGATIQTPGRLTQRIAQQLTGAIDVVNATGVGPAADGPAAGGETGTGDANLPAADMGAVSGQNAVNAGVSFTGAGQLIASLDSVSGDAIKVSEISNNIDVLNQFALDTAGLLPLNVIIPAMIQLSWAGLKDMDFDLHLSGPAGGQATDPARGATAGRFHIFSGNPGAYNQAPFAALDGNESGFTGTEVIGISRFTAGSYRVEVNGTDTVTQAVIAPDVLSGMGDLLRVRYVSQGTLQRGPNGSVAASGMEMINLAPKPGQLGVTWTAFDIVSRGGDAVDIIPRNLISDSVVGAFSADTSTGVVGATAVDARPVP